MSSIWFNKSITLEDIKDFGKETMASYFDIKWIKKPDLKKYTSKTYQTIIEVLNQLEK